MSCEKFNGCVQGQGHSEDSKCQYMLVLFVCLFLFFGHYPLNDLAFCNQTWNGDVLSWVWVSCWKTGLLLQGQSRSKDLCNRNMTVSTKSSEQLTLLQSKLVRWYILIYQSVGWKKIGLLCSRSRSPQKFRMLVNVCLMIPSKPQNILLWNLVLLCSIIS